MSKNRVIGKDNTLPWHLPADLKHFKALTMGRPMIMGRLTYDSIGRPLPGRVTIVVTRDASWQGADGVLVATSLDDALAQAKISADELNVDEIMVVGGANIYQQLLARVDELHVTEVEMEVDGDAYFPEIDLHQWREIDRKMFPASPTIPAYAFVHYKKHND